MEFVEVAVLSSVIYAEVTDTVAGLIVGSGYPLQQSLWMLEGFPENQMCSEAWSSIVWPHLLGLLVMKVAS